MTSIRPTSIPDFPTDKGWGITNAWVVNEEDVVYLEVRNKDRVYYFSFTPLEKGIGGRLIEPVFENNGDFFTRTIDLNEGWGVSIGLDEGDEALMNRAMVAWNKFRRRYGRPMYDRH